MTINQISYQKTYNLGNYSSERIGVEITLNEGEDAKEALNTAKHLVEEYHQQTDQSAYPFTQEVHFITTPIPEIQVKEQPELREQTLEEQIMSCKEKKVLESYKFIAKKDPILNEAYGKRMEQLKLSKN